MILRIQILDNKGKKVILQEDHSSEYIAHFSAIRGQAPLNEVFYKMLEKKPELKDEFFLNEEKFKAMQNEVISHLKENELQNLDS
jgi:hypothetical protein